MSDAKLTLAAVLLAAGPSTRLGQPKQLVRFREETLVRRAARMLCEATAGEVVVVTGCEAEKVTRESAGLPVRIVMNHEWEKGMGGSIACGASRLSSVPDGILVGVCDQWLLEKSDLKKLVSCWIEAPDRIHVASWKEGTADVSGPPVIFPGRLKGELKGLDKRRGARQIIDRYIDRVEFVPLDSAAHDLDRPFDLERLEKSAN